MIKYFSSILLLFIIVISCSNSTQKTSTSDIVEESSLYKDPTENLGESISTIYFEMQATDPELIDSGFDITEGISLSIPYSNKAYLIDSSEIVLPYSTVTLIIDYPLTNQAVFELTATDSKGFTRKELIAQISKKYHDIYAEEENSAKIKTIPADHREGLSNRNKTDGKYGIWGHDLSDLFLKMVEVYKDSKNNISLYPIVES